MRNTTWTSTRDGTEGVTFLQPTFYDGQGMMVAADSGITDLAGLEGGVVCVAAGTTTEGNVATEFERLGLQVPEIQSFDDVNVLQQAFQEGRCDGWSSDRSQLTGLRSNCPDGPEALVILDGTFSKEPLAPGVRDGDSQWAQAVEWAVFATVQAEEFGVTSRTSTRRRESDDPSIRAFLGSEVEGEEGAAVLDPGLGLPTTSRIRWSARWGTTPRSTRSITPLGLDRGTNALDRRRPAVRTALPLTRAPHVPPTAVAGRASCNGHSKSWSSARSWPSSCS